MLYKLSPLLTSYIIYSADSSGPGEVVGIVSLCPTFKRFDVNLFAALSSATVTLNLFAILYNVSPDTFFM